MKKLTVINMIEKFQCPGCVAGSDIECGSYEPTDAGEGFSCESHVAGTNIMGVGAFALGMPKGFNKCGIGWDDRGKRKHLSKMNIRFWIEGTKLVWNNLNVPVWAMVKDGFLFVRTYAPRVNFTTVDVVEGGTLDMVPGALNVADFIDDID